MFSGLVAKHNWPIENAIEYVLTITVMCLPFETIPRQNWTAKLLQYKSLIYNLFAINTVQYSLYLGVSDTYQ